MSTNFQVAFKKHNGNLHVHPSGDLDGSSALELIRLLHRKYDGNGEVVIDTRRLRKILPFGSTTFQSRVKECRIPYNRLSFRGEKGHDIAPEGCRVIESSKKHKCRGNCPGCVCSQKKKSA
ncbi:MAG: hypothetical protein PVJ19_22445 [Desulfobacteraceae bacterium]|jgi:hypothetical protein